MRLLTTPKKGSRSSRSFQLQVPAYGPNGAHGSSTWSVTGEHHVKIGQVALLQPIVNVLDFFRRSLGTLELLVTSVIACVKVGF